MPIWITPTLLKNIGITLGAILLIFGIYMKGRHDVQINFDAYKAEVKAVADEQNKQAEKTDLKNQKLLKDTQNAYNTSIANLRTYYQLRYGKSISKLPEVSSATTGIDGYSPDNLPATPILASQCAETTLTLLSLQNFIRGVTNNAE